MLKIVTSEEMRLLDKRTIEELGIPGMVLMENAGRAVYNRITEICRKDKKILILAGKGNNGGDAFVVARHLFNKGYNISVFLTGNKTELKGDALANINIIEKLGIEIKEIYQEKDDSSLPLELSSADMVVDGLLGTGITGGARGIIADIITLVNNSQKPVISIDTPSGLDCTTGKVEGPCIKAMETITFGLPKRGMFIFPGRKYTGKIIVADISIPSAYWLRDDKFITYLITPAMINKYLPLREADCHKGTCGKVLIIAGSTGLTGAAYLSSLACLKAGSGLVTLGVPKSLNHILEIKLTEVMTKPLPETDACTLSIKGLDEILKISCDCMAIGPGLSLHQETSELVKKLITSVTVPMVIDADGLNGLSSDISILSQAKAPVILTPHPGEMARLASIDLNKVKNSPVDVAMEFATKWKVWLILKVPHTIIATPSGKIYFNPTGNSGMATGGTGDVLTGIITSFLGQGCKPLQACLCGVFIHGLAGDIASENISKESLLAGDLIDYLPHSFKKMKEDKTHIIEWINI